MTDLRIHVLGYVAATRSGAVLEPAPQSVRHLLGLLAAAGPDGIDREQLAHELWQGSPPSSWQSALRNRATRARQHLDPNCLTRVGRRLSLAATVSVDSWDLLERRIGPAAHLANHLEVLEGEVLASVPASPAVDAHRLAVMEARIGLIQELVSTRTELSAAGLQRMRALRGRHPQNPALAVAVVGAHRLAGYHEVARELVDSIAAELEAKQADAVWFRELEQSTKDAFYSVSSPVPSTTGDRHQSLFDTAVEAEDWGLAFEIAMAGLPEAERSDGDPERLKKLEAIPLDGLNPTYRFTLALALTRHLLYVGREQDALHWCRVTAELASEPSEELLVYIMRAVVGERSDALVPIPLPAAFEDAPWEELSLRSLQVAVISHLERSSWEEASPLQQRFETLVESSGQPYRRWHLLLLNSMTHFVAGRLDAAADDARQAHSYGTVFGIADADRTLMTQMSNASLFGTELASIEDYAAQYPTSAMTVPGRALQAIASAAHDDGTAVAQFVHSFDYRSRAIFSFPISVLIAPFVRDTVIRSEIEVELRHRSGTSVIYGTGALHLGPVDRTIARLVSHRQEAVDSLGDAIAVADKQRTRVWQVVCRLDLAAASGRSEHRDAAQELVNTPELQTLVHEYESPFAQR